MADDIGRKARIGDLHELAMGMSYVTVENGTSGNPVFQVGEKSFIFFRNPRRDAVAPETGEGYQDVIVFWVGPEATSRRWSRTKRRHSSRAPHFDGHPSVLLRASRIGERTLQE